MTNELVFKNARIILEDEIVYGSLVVRDGEIGDFSNGSTRAGEDCEGDTIIPGLIELHTDHLESQYVPRPKVVWNAHAAVQSHDAQIAASGITTVLDALRVGADEDQSLSGDDMRKMADVIEQGTKAGHLRADHLLHLRCEVSAPDCLDNFALFDEDERVRLVSLMDHAPGQRQFVSLDAYKTYYMGKKGMSEAEFEVFCKKRVEESQENSPGNRAAVSKACRERNIRLASHDDATLDHVDEALRDGITVAEFPTTEIAAKASHENGLAVLMGAPNLIRGGSHSGNVSAKALAEAGHLDILSSDYIPFSLITAAFNLSDAVDHISLPDAINTVTRNPAQAVGLNDRGRIAQGLRADLVRVATDHEVPVVRSVWREGKRVV
ncbi:MAG: alpha-D-ribose 1-methylphosphonate 5-triphosphate diphosphatase [Pseudomonadota bacterium]